MRSAETDISAGVVYVTHSPALYGVSLLITSSGTRRRRIVGGHILSTVTNSAVSKFCSARQTERIGSEKLGKIVNGEASQETDVDVPGGWDLP